MLKSVSLLSILLIRVRWIQILGKTTATLPSKRRLEQDTIFLFRRKKRYDYYEGIGNAGFTISSDRTISVTLVSVKIIAS